MNGKALDFECGISAPVQLEVIRTFGLHPQVWARKTLADLQGDEQ